MDTGGTVVSKWLKDVREGVITEGLAFGLALLKSSNTDESVAQIMY